MDDPVVGGYTKEKIALRRAIGMAYNVDEEIRVVRPGPGDAGHADDPARPDRARSRISRRMRSYDPARRKALLDKFGYIDRDGDGWRDLPDGKPLMLQIGVDLRRSTAVATSCGRRTCARSASASSS